MTDINDVTLQGVIVHKFVTPKIAILTISTGNATPTTNYPKVLCFGDLRSKVETEFNERDFVKVLGNIQSSRLKPGIKNQSTIAVFADSVEYAESSMQKAFGVDSPHSYIPFINEIKIEGVVTNIECPVSNMVRIRVLTHKNGRQSFVRLVHFTNNPEEIINLIHPQDTIMAIGCVQTGKKTIKGEVRHFENYVVSEIVKCD